MANELTTAEAATLRGCEGVIERGKKAFFEVGNALATIKDDRLYRETYDTFDEYCSAKWGFKRTYAHYLIESAGVVERVHNCEQKPPILPTAESQVRPLAKLPKDEQAEAWEEAVDSADGKQPTAKQVKEVVEKRKAPKNGAEVWNEETVTAAWKKLARGIDDLVGVLKAAFQARGEALKWESKRPLNALDNANSRAHAAFDDALKVYRESK